MLVGSSYRLLKKRWVRQRSLLMTLQGKWTILYLMRRNKVARKTTQETLVKHGIPDDQAASITGTVYDAPVIADDFLPPGLRAIKEADVVPAVAGSSRNRAKQPCV